MYTVEALNDTKLTEVKQIAAELGITTVEDKRCKHLWVRAIIAVQGGEPITKNSADYFESLIRGWFNARWDLKVLADANKPWVLELYERCREHYLDLCGDRFDSPNFETAFWRVATELCPKAFSFIAPPLPCTSVPLPTEAFVATPSASPVTNPEPEEEEDDEEDEMWEEEEEDPDGDEERGAAPWDDPDDCLDDECLDDFQDAYEYFEYKGWIIYGDGNLSYQDPKTQVWEEWEYDRSLDDAIRELERHIDRIEFDRAVSPGQLQLDLFPTSEVQIANVSDSLTWEVAPLLVAELRDSCRAIDSDISIDATEQSAIVPAPGVATEKQVQRTCSHCKGKGFIREDTSDLIHFWRCDRCDSTGLVSSSIDATEQSVIVPTPGVATERKTFVTCFDCHGSGRLRKRSRHFLTWPRCDRCNGAGSFLFVPSAITSARSPPGRVPK